MNQAFDPYHKWLGILPKDQPPHHYRLLGLVVFESDPDAIDNAANSRMTQLRMYQTGEHAAASEALLNDIAAARICLLDPTRKTMYDRQLRQQLATQEAAQPLPPVGGAGIAAAHPASAGRPPSAMPVGGANAVPQAVPTAMPAVPTAMPAMPNAIPVGSPGAVPQANPVAMPGIPDGVPVATPIEQGLSPIEQGLSSRRESSLSYSTRRRHQSGLSQTLTMGLVFIILLVMGVGAVLMLGAPEIFRSTPKERPKPTYYYNP